MEVPKIKPGEKSCRNCIDFIWYKDCWKKASEIYKCENFVERHPKTEDKTI